MKKPRPPDHIQTKAPENQSPPQPAPSGEGSKADSRPPGELHLAVAPSPSGGRLGWGLAFAQHHINLIVPICRPPNAIYCRAASAYKSRAGG